MRFAADSVAVADVRRCPLEVGRSLCFRRQRMSFETELRDAPCHSRKLTLALPHRAKSGSGAAPRESCELDEEQHYPRRRRTVEQTQLCFARGGALSSGARSDARTQPPCAP